MNKTEGVPYGRFLRFGSVFFLVGLHILSARADLPLECHNKNFDGYVRIKHVIDGDTVILETGEHVRLIGIDTPEIDHKGSASEAGAVAARDYLLGLITYHQVDYPVHFDRERHDRHGRTLAHLFLPNGDNIQALILVHGHATPLTIPPNLRYLACYQLGAKQAIDTRRGLWELPQYQPVDVKNLTGNVRGYHQVTGTVTRIGQSRTSIWINLGRNFAVRILRENLKYFLDVGALIGKTVRVRGKLYKQNSQLRMRLNHGVDIEILPD